MTQRESDEQRKLSRRTFIQYSAAASGTALGVCAMTMKTDALAQTPGQASFGGEGDKTSYEYK